MTHGISKQIVTFGTVLLVACASLTANAAPKPKSGFFENLSSEFQPVDNEVRKLLEQAYSDNTNGNTEEALSGLKRAYDKCRSRRLIGDCAIVETAIGQVYFFLGRLKDAEEN